MRIAFLGKGGSGKTTTSAGFIRYAAQKHPFVLAIDADVNVHLRQALNLKTETTTELSTVYDDTEAYFKGDRTDLGKRPLVGSTPPSTKSRFITTISPNDPYLKKYAVIEDNILLLTVGTYKEKDVSSSCFHGKLSSLSIMMHHTLDTENDIIIADTTAGVDNVATSLHLAYDMNLFMVEPTAKSVKVFHDFVALAPHLAERTFAVANKIASKNDEAFIKENIPQDKLIASVPQSKSLKRFEQGDEDALAEFQAEQSAVFDAIYGTLKKQKRNWSEYLKLLQLSFEKESKKWLNAYYSAQLDTGLDADFRYENVAQNRPVEAVRVEAAVR